jgi:hypothetical protein
MPRRRDRGGDRTLAADRYDVGTPESYAEACRLFEARAWR